MAGLIRTVTGDIAPEELGVCLPHEHLLGQPPAVYTSPDLTLDSEAAAALELNWFRQAGGQSIVDMSTPDYGRNPAGLRRLSEINGVYVIGATGYNKEKFSAAFLQEKSVEQLAKAFVQDVCEGMDGSDIRAGLIKASSTLNEISPLAEKMFRAAAIAHHETGAPVSTHTEAGTMALEQVMLLKELKVPADKIIIGHTDRRLDWELHQRLAEEGVYLGYDQISKEKYYPDSKRIEFILRLIDAGYGDQILLSGDMARRSYWPSYNTGGGPGFTYILWRFVPWLIESGMERIFAQKLLVENPARALQISR